MPRRNKRKTAASGLHFHAPLPSSHGYKPGCSRCAFVGLNYVCLTSDGNCLITSPPKTRGVGDAEVVRETNTASTKR